MRNKNNCQKNIFYTYLNQKQLTTSPGVNIFRALEQMNKNGLFLSKI